MKHVIHKEKSWAVTYDAGLMEVPGPDNFSVDYWRSREAVTGEAIGRGSAWFVETPHGPVVLRHYLRGGWAATVSRQNYFFTGVMNSRPFREYHVLVELYAKGLPVPRPIAALCEHRGVLSTGAIMTACIPSAKTLADILAAGNTVEGICSKVGSCIRKFHEAGAWHADLNVRNILLDADYNVYLIDFDRARFNPGKRVNGEGNLKRLKRSFQKLWAANGIPEQLPAWHELKAGYDG